MLDTARLMPAECPYDYGDSDDPSTPGGDGSGDGGGDGSGSGGSGGGGGSGGERGGVLRWAAAAKCSHLIYQLRPKIVLQV